jgi:tetratricopeptide (TPR) repeat protein
VRTGDRIVDVGIAQSLRHQHQTQARRQRHRCQIKSFAVRKFSIWRRRQAAELENSTPKHPVTPGPTLPAQEQLGDLLMELKQPALALAAFQRSLELYPKRFNSVLGAARAAQALGDRSQARSFYAALLEIAGGGTRQAELKEARKYLAAKD